MDMNQPLNMSALFEEYGRAAHYAQLLEYDLLSIWILDLFTQGVSLTRQDLLDFQASWGRKTLGLLLKPLEKSALIPDDMKQFMEVLRKDRNRLVHSFFMDESVTLETDEGIEGAFRELVRIKQNLDTGRRFFHSVLDSYARDRRIDIEQIDAEVKQRILGTEQED